MEPLFQVTAIAVALVWVFAGAWAWERRSLCRKAAAETAAARLSDRIWAVRFRAYCQ